MKTTNIIALAVTCIYAFPAFAAEHLFTNFDDYPTGSVAQISGWGALPGVNARTAVVSSALSYSSPNGLNLPWNADTNSGVSAVFTNLKVAYTATNEPIVRFSARFWLDNSNTFFQIGLRNTNTGALLSFQSLSGYGTVGFKYRDMVFVPMKTPGWSHIAVYYNMSNRHMALEYNYSNVLAWADTDSESGSSLACTQFHQFVVTRITNTVNTMGAMYVEDVRVESFPPHLVTWWRFEESGQFVVDRLGSIKPMIRVGFADIERDPDDDRIFDGATDYHNEGARRQVAAGPNGIAQISPRMTNWTLEAIFRAPSEEGPTQLIDAGYQFGFNATGTFMKLAYVGNQTNFAFSLRDDDGGDSTSYQFSYMGKMAADEAWHHVAWVKTQSILKLYVDYRPVATNILNNTADGAYRLLPGMDLCIGRTLNNGNISHESAIFDEIRLSSKALTPEQFLIGSAPRILKIAPDPAGHILGLELRGPGYRWQTLQWASSADGPWSNAPYMVSGPVYLYGVEAPMPPFHPAFIRTSRAP